MANYRRADAPGACYFFTVVTYRRRQFLTDEPARRILREAIIQARQKYPFVIDAWVLLPDHLHCMWTLPEGDNDFSTRWNVIKTIFSRRAKTLYHNAEWMNVSKTKHREITIWQRRFWEHCIRDERDYANHVDYIHYNPIKHGWVERMEDWLYSSFHRYVKQGWYANENEWRKPAR